MNLFAILPILLATAQTTLPPSVDGLPIGAIPQQKLPVKGCAAFLWTATGSRTLIAMATVDPAQLRLSIGGTITDLPRVAQHEAGGFGFAGNTRYQLGEVTAFLDMSIVTRDDLKDGATIPQATLRLDRTGQDSIVVPVAGLVGCAP